MPPQINTRQSLLPEIEGLSEETETPLAELMAVISAVSTDHEKEKGRVESEGSGEGEMKPTQTPAASMSVAPLAPGMDGPASAAALGSASSSRDFPVPIPIPTKSADKSEASFVYPENNGDTTVLAFGALSPEIASADISIAHDGSFVETSSGAAAMELRKLYDQHYGVGKGVISPYAITALINQHGQQRYRVGRRDMPATDPLAAENTEDVPIATPSSGKSSTGSGGDQPNSRHKRRSQMSFGGLQQILKNGTISSAASKRPSTAATPQIPRKLRKTRSIPEGMRRDNENIGRGHSHSVTSVEVPTYATIGPANGHHTYLTRRRKAGDMFGEVMDWGLVPMTSSRSRLSGSQSTRSLVLPTDGNDSLDSVGGSSPQSEYDTFPSIIAHPFGRGVSFEPPSKRSGNEYLKTPRMLREMQSFESGLTARQADSPDHLKTERLSTAHSTSTVEPGDFGLVRQQSAIRLRDSSASSFAAEVAASLASASAFASTSAASSILAPSSSSPHSVSPIPPEPIAEEPAPVDGPLPATSLLSRYSTNVFDVLQTYRGVPLIDKLSPEAEETTVIKLSLSADDSAAPKNDPRFIIWGEMHHPTSAESAQADNGSISHDSGTTDLTGSSPSISRKRRSFKSTKSREKDSTPAPPLPTLSLSGSQGGRGSGGGQDDKMIVAATIERWIAQLTSVLDYDEMLNFFLTYRTYISSTDLCHLLICRFHWALQKAPPGEETKMSAQEDKVKRIVRVRTFVAWRYWLLTFFTVDFLPNRELRVMVANWLNTLSKDPILKKHSDGVSIVKKLKRVVKDCKEATNVPNVPSKSKAPPKDKAAAPQPTTKESKLFGEKFAEATRKFATAEDEDSDVDFDFFDESTDNLPSATSSSHLSSVHLGATLTSPVTPLPLSSLDLLRRTDNIPMSATEPIPSPFIQTPATLPIHHGVLSRAFVKTMGRLGRWRRVLNNRGPQLSPRAPLAACANVSAFDLELTESGDMLLSVEGGVERYLRVIGQGSPAPTPGPSTHAARKDATKTEAPAQVSQTQPADGPSEIKANEKGTSTPRPNSMVPIQQQPQVGAEKVDVPLEERTIEEEHAPSISTSVPVVQESRTPVEPPPNYAESVKDTDPEPALPPGIIQPNAQPDREFDPYADFQDSRRNSSRYSVDEVSIARTSSTESFGQPLTHVAAFQSPWQFDVVSIDDLNLSGGSSDELNGPALPPGLRQPARRLPFRRDFELVQRPESVSSLGINARNSVASSESYDSVGLGTGIQQWQLNALLDSLANDDDDAADRDAALRRLEGDINPQKQQEKVSKVDGWVKNIRARMAAGDYTEEMPRFPVDDYDEGDAQSHYEPDGQDSSPDILVVSPVEDEGTDGEVSASESIDETSVTPRSPDAKPAPEDAVPLEILQSRVSAEIVPPLVRPSGKSKFASAVSETHRVHKSYLLSYRAEELAQHFAMIDRELFMGVKFEELVLDEWIACEEVNVLDWAQYLKDRARWKAEQRWPEKTSALAAVRGRFNLMANFTVSEIVLTQPSERHLVFSKFLRIAQKSFALHSYNTLIAIVTALRSEWVSVSMRKYWGKLGMYEARIFSDLKQWTTSEDHFRHVKAAVQSLVDAKPLDGSSHAAGSVTSGGAEASSARGKNSGEWNAVAACIPFIGIYLSQLYTLSRLPDLIDPTAPNEAVSIDPETANFDAPAHPDVFSTLAPLPPSMHLEPLINVQKQRMIAQVIKSLVASQHLASRVQFPVDKKLFQQCLRLRGLDNDTLQRALSMYQE